jgi:hypothetical protein
MNIGHLPVDQAANQDVVAIGQLRKHGEDFMAFRMRSPAALDRPTSDSLRQARSRPLGRGEHHAMLADERLDFFGGHAGPGLFSKSLGIGIGSQGTLIASGWPPSRAKCPSSHRERPDTRPDTTERTQ